MPSNLRTLTFGFLTLVRPEMTTSNNSVFKSFFEKQKLTKGYFIDWYRAFRITLSAKDLLPYLEQPIPELHVPPEGQQIPLDNLEGLCAYAILKELKTMFCQQVKQELLETEYDSFMQNYNMHGLGKIMLELHAMLKLHEKTLPKKDVALAIHAIRAGSVQKLAYAPNNKQKKLSNAAKRNNQGKGKRAVAFAPKPKIPPPLKRENLAKDAIHHLCGEVGH
ncbi:hypothetical protein Tco_0007910 [Tanacetum coccineum]